MQYYFVKCVARNYSKLMNKNYVLSNYKKSNKNQQIF